MFSGGFSYVSNSDTFSRKPNTNEGVEILKSKKQVTKSQNGRFAKDAGSKPISTSHDAEKLATKGSKNNMKKNAHTSVATRGKQDATLQSTKSRSDSRTMEGANKSLQGRAITVLSHRDWEILMTALEGPQEPGPELVKMWQKYA